MSTSSITAATTMAASLASGRLSKSRRGELAGDDREREPDDEALEDRLGHELARKPRRSSPASSAMIPVVATVRVVNAPVQGCASCATAAAESAAVAHIGPVTRWREPPNAA